MKKFFSILVICVMGLTFTFCDNSARIKAEREQFIRDSTAKAEREQFVRDSTAKAEREQFIRDSTAKAEHITAIKNSIQLTSYYLHSPNSVGGCDMSIYYKNLSKKVIKYAVFICRYYNAVDDVVYCDIRDYSTFRGRDTGPVNYGRNGGGLWECPIYNWSARKMEIIGIEIDYMDGTELVISQNDMNLIKGYKGIK